MQGLAVPLFHTVCVCVCVRERERNAWCFLQNTIAIWDDYVMAKWSREGEGGQNNRERERERERERDRAWPFLHPPPELSLGLFCVICHFSRPYLVPSYQTGSTVTLPGQ